MKKDAAEEKSNSPHEEKEERGQIYSEEDGMVLRTNDKEVNISPPNKESESSQGNSAQPTETDLRDKTERTEETKLLQPSEQEATVLTSFLTGVRYHLHFFCGLLVAGFSFSLLCTLTATRFQASVGL